MKIRQINTFINKALALSLTVAATAGLTGCGTASVRSKELSAAAAAPADGAEAEDGEESFENTEYGGVKSYLEYAGIEAQQDAADARVIKIAYGYSGYPISYTTKDGEVSGYDIEVLKAVDALLPGYRFAFVPSQGGDDLLLGVQTGKFNGAVRNWFQTAERKEIFSFPEKNLGLSVTGLTVRTEDLEKIHDFASLSDAGGLLAPVDPGDGHYTVLKNWCEAHPDRAWEFETGSLASKTDAFAWVSEGRYDAYFGLEVNFNSIVKAEDGPAHQYADTLTWTPCAAIPTYVIFSLDDKDVADAFDSVIDQVWESGYTNYLQETLYGTDYISEYGRDGLGVFE